MKFNAILPSIDWIDNGGRYLIHPLTDRLRLDADSIISNKPVLVNFREDFGKTEMTKYLKGIRLKTSAYDPNFQESTLVIEQYKSIVPYCYESRFSYHFPIGINLWLMVAIR